jgi:hypothetical protein
MSLISCQSTSSSHANPDFTPDALPILVLDQSILVARLSSRMLKSTQFLRLRMYALTLPLESFLIHLMNPF